jgi:glycosyl transferase family 25
MFLMRPAVLTEIPRLPAQTIEIYLINIGRAEDRLRTIQQQSLEFGISVERVEGVDGAQLPQDQWVGVDHDRFQSRHGRVILPGEYGCYRSHLMALERFLADGGEQALIIEDDISLDNEFLDRAMAVKATVPNADVIKLVNHRWNGFRPFSRSDKGDIVGRCLFGPQGSTACYLVTRRGAEKIVRSLAIMSLPWDVAIERGWDIGISIWSTRANIVGFSPLQRTTMIGWRRDYKAAKSSALRRVPAHIFRTVDFFRRLVYVLTSR